MRGFVRLLVVVAVPILLILTNVRIVMNEWYVRWEYSKPGFPPSELLTSDVRYRAAVTTVDYVRGAKPLEAIASLDDRGRVLYNEREIRHLVDVRNVATTMIWVDALALAVIILGSLYLAARDGRRGWLGALRGGAFLTIALLVLLGLLSILNFDWFFTKFHQVFFEGSTWLFNWTDTLIQLYPLPFWFDITLLLAGMTIVEALVLGMAAWLGRGPARPAPRLRPTRRTY